MGQSIEQIEKNSQDVRIFFRNLLPIIHEVQPN
jgi:hypothetical protein